MTNLPFLDRLRRTAPFRSMSMRTGEWSDWIERHSETLRRLAAAHDFQAQNGRILLVPATDGSIERVLFGVGDKANVNGDRRAGAASAGGDYRIAFAPREFAATIDRHRLGPRRVCVRPLQEAQAPRPAACAAGRRGHGRSGAHRRASWLARDLVNTPTNDMGPEALHAAAEARGARAMAPSSKPSSAMSC